MREKVMGLEGYEVRGERNRGFGPGAFPWKNSSNMSMYSLLTAPGYVKTHQWLSGLNSV